VPVHVPVHVLVHVMTPYLSTLWHGKHIYDTNCVKNSFVMSIAIKQC